ncbi:hypothetical protein EBU99_06260 [bacterium]|nr:hypothetical protein [bacterium]
MSLAELSAKRRFFRLVVSSYVPMILAALLFFFWFRSFAIEPFDFDEAIYRRMAEEMKAAGQWLSQPVFNGESYNHKPPTYIGVLAGLSYLIDGSAAQVTSFSSRFASVLCSLLTAALLHKTWKLLLGKKTHLHFEERHLVSQGVSPIIFILMSFLPTVASSAVLLDPMLVFFTSLFVCCEALRLLRNSTAQFSFYCFLGSVFGMFGATATKGLIGLVLPAGSAVLFCFLSELRNPEPMTLQSFFRMARKGSTRFLPQWMIAFFLSAGFYCLLWQTGGAGFVKEFFILHHFGRATSAMEGHSGPVFYYIPLLIIGGGFLLSWLSYLLLLPKSQSALIQSKEESKQSTPTAQLWLFSWCAFCVLFFSLLATKLPNYIWPIWPILALLAALLSEKNSFTIAAKQSRALLFCARSFAFALPMIFFLCSIGIFLWKPFCSHFVELQPRELAIVSAVLPHETTLAVGFLLAALCLAFGAVCLLGWGERTLKKQHVNGLLLAGVARWLALSQVAACVALMVFVIPAAEEVMTSTVQQSTAKARMFLGVGDKLSTADLYSPNVVSSSGEPVVLGIGEGEWLFEQARANVILTPVWNVGVCTRHGYDVAQAVEYLRICLRTYQRTLEGPGH